MFFSEPELVRFTELPTSVDRTANLSIKCDLTNQSMIPESGIWIGSIKVMFPGSTAPSSIFVLKPFLGFILASLQFGSLAVFFCTHFPPTRRLVSGYLYAQPHHGAAAKTFPTGTQTVMPKTEKIHSPQAGLDFSSWKRTHTRNRSRSGAFRKHSVHRS